MRMIKFDIPGLFRTILVSILVFTAVFALAGLAFAWQVHIYWRGYPDLNPISPYEGYLDGMIQRGMGTQPPHAEGDSPIADMRLDGFRYVVNRDDVGSFFVWVT